MFDIARERSTRWKVRATAAVLASFAFAMVSWLPVSEGFGRYLPWSHGCEEDNTGAVEPIVFLLPDGSRQQLSSEGDSVQLGGVSVTLYDPPRTLPTANRPVELTDISVSEPADDSIGPSSIYYPSSRGCQIIELRIDGPNRSQVANIIDQLLATIVKDDRGV